MTLATGRPEIARDILLEYSKHISEGMLPNRFPDEGETPEYNTVDATLWYFEAIRRISSRRPAISDLMRQLYPKLVDIIVWHVRGTRYGIKMDATACSTRARPGTQLTWMDAKVGVEVFTPRTGKPVEIQALWYNALSVMVRARTRDARYQGRSTIREWRLEQSAISTRVFGITSSAASTTSSMAIPRDASIRPNQIFAVSLTHSMLPRPAPERSSIKSKRELLTPVGLRIPRPERPALSRPLRGSPYERDSAYHQGTVWAWLIGHFVDAYRKVHPVTRAPTAESSEIIEGLESTLTTTMLGQVSEIFDGDPPHTPRGAAAQAWSVAELLRIKMQPR